MYAVTLNEEERLPHVLDKVKLVADEIIIVDSGSTDRTKEVAEKYGAKFIYHEWRSIGHQVSFAESCCSNRWVLAVAGDEVLSDELVEDILKIKEGANPADGYKIRVGDVYPGIEKPSRWVKHMNLVRLYNRDKLRMSGKYGHDDVVPADPAVKPKVVQLDSFIIHYGFWGVAHLVAKRNRHSDMQRNRAVAEHKNYPPFRMVGAILPNIFKFFVLDRMFIYGWWGLINSVSLAFTRFLKFAKCYEYEQLLKHDFIGLEKQAYAIRDSEDPDFSNRKPEDF
jgi:glycosyltransferase involved in cell wall biosynthesis